MCPGRLDAHDRLVHVTHRKEPPCPSEPHWRSPSPAPPSIPAVAHAGGHDGRDQLVGRAVLEVETYAPGPPAGDFFKGTVTRGIEFPLPSQPVEGFSSIVEGRHRGEWLAMPDNGFGTKLNSYDFLIRAYYLRPDFKTAHGGTGQVHVGEFIQFSDPQGLIGFPIYREGVDRLLTGADIDPESLQRGRDGSLWVGDEFGPWILHFDARGRLLHRPFALPDGLVSPSNPWLGGGTATVGGSRGIEGMAISPNGRYLTVILEGAVPVDAPSSRRIYEFDTRSETFTARLRPYRVEADANFVADVQALDRNRLLVIERDGAAALFRRVYEVDLRRVARDGYLRKTEVVDLAAIPDPKGVSLPPIHDGDVGLGDPFRVMCESSEALRIVSAHRVLVGCDNNFPNAGRNPNLADDNEFIVVRV